MPEPVSILLLWRWAAPIANSGVGLDWGGAARNRIAIGPQPLRGEWLSDFDKKRGLWLETRQFRKRDTPDPFSTRCQVEDRLDRPVVLTEGVNDKRPGLGRLVGVPHLHVELEVGLNPRRDRDNDTHVVMSILIAGATRLGSRAAASSRIQRPKSPGLSDRAEYTVREWCRQGLENSGEEGTSGRCKGDELLVSHDEFVRLRNEGPLPFRLMTEGKRSWAGADKCPNEPRVPRHQV